MSLSMHKSYKDYLKTTTILVSWCVATSCVLVSQQPEAESSLVPVDDVTEYGTTAEKLDGITTALQSFVDEEKLAGIHTIISRDGKIVYESTLGTRGAIDKQPLQTDDLFRIYSMTKPITAVALMQLYEKGAFELDDPITKFIPEFDSLTVWQQEGDPIPLDEPFTMRQLLTHTAGFTYTFTPHPVDQMYRDQQVLGSTDLEEMIDKLVAIPLRFTPGQRWHYSVAVDVTGLVVERISKQPFDEYLDEHIFSPLGMHDTFFGVPVDKWDRFLPNHSWNRQTSKLLQQPAAMAEGYREANTTFFSGGGGLVSTAMDYLRFCEAVRQGGTLDGVKILNPETVELMIDNHIPQSLAVNTAGERPTEQRSAGLTIRGFGLGFGIDLAEDDPDTTTRYYWGGAAGTVFWIDPVNNMSVVSLIQLMGSPHNLGGVLGDSIQTAWSE